MAKKQGHYCKVCGTYRSNESFSGKGHSAHICKKCAALSPAERSKDMISHLRRTSNNFNQIARRVNSTNRIYEDDIREMKGMLEQIWEANNKVLEKLAAID